VRLLYPRAVAVLGTILLIVGSVLAAFPPRIPLGPGQMTLLNGPFSFSLPSLRPAYPA